MTTQHIAKKNYYLAIKPKERNIQGESEIYKVTKICFYRDAISTRLIIVRNNKLLKMAGRIN